MLPLLMFIRPSYDDLGSLPLFWSLVFALKERTPYAACLVPEGPAFHRLCPRVFTFPWAQWQAEVESRRRGPPCPGDDTGLVSDLKGRWKPSPNDVVLVPYESDVKLDVLLTLFPQVFGPTFVFLRSDDIDAQTKEASFEAVSCYVLFLTPTLDNVDDVKRLRGKLLARGVLKERIRTLLFNAGLPGALTQKTVEKELGELDFVIPSDLSLLLRAQSEGQPVQTLKPRSPLAEGVRQAAQRMASFFNGEHPSGEKTSAPPIPLANVKKIVIERLWRQWEEEKSHSAAGGETLHRQIDREIHDVLVECRVGDVDLEAIQEMHQAVFDHLAGLGPLEKWLRDEAVSDIMINGRERLYLEREGRMERTAETIGTEAQLKVMIDRMVGQAGRRVDKASPLCDVRLKNGSRVNVVLPPIALHGPVVTVRRFRAAFMTFEDLIRQGTLKEAHAAQLIRDVRGRHNIVIAGNSGSGKTTLLNILSSYIEENERVITIEDAAELKLQQSHVVALESRPPNAEGEGEITMVDLVVNALRMRPDRIIVGECRGAEAIPMLQAMNTGHDGCMTTLHANSAEEALWRLEAMVLIGAPQWPSSVVRQQIASALDLIVYLKRIGTERRLTEMVKVQYEDGHLTVSSNL
ncbi:MAG: Flp pilus assembly complex ATPase component TadA [Elusimicrobia bacterium]|nr:Flp pilus assembly complex ATPase component TadA [Candidatus Obscuribacterium magneticum]